MKFNFGFCRLPTNFSGLVGHLFFSKDYVNQIFESKNDSSGKINQTKQI